MRIAMIADTPYQLMNCINFMMNNPSLNADLFIGQQFRNCNEISELICNLHIFDNTYKYQCKTYSNRFTRYVSKLHETVFLERHLRKSTHNLFRPSTVSYNYIWMSLYTNFSEAFKIYYKDVPVVFYDDGFGTYSGNIVPENYQLRRKITLLLGRKFPDLKPICIYVNNYNEFKSDYIKEVKQLPKIDDGNPAIHYLRLIFGDCDSDYYFNKAIYLTQPSFGDQVVCQTLNKNIIRVLGEIDKNVILRVHPRDDIDLYKDLGCAIDSNQLWELACSSEISNNNILVGVYSSAQIMPKMLFGKEPHIIFLYKIFKQCFTKEEYSKIDLLITKIRNSYVEREKIYAPETIEEMKHLFVKISKEIENNA